MVENKAAVQVGELLGIGKVERVELEEKKHKTCYCNRDFTVEEVKSLVKTINGTDKIWDLENCNVDDKSYERLTLELNNMFRKYGINECIQKIAFLAMTSVETGFFRTAGEIAGNTASSQYYYKGRGLLQLTGDGSKPTIYEEYKKELGGKYDVVKNPDLVARNIYLVVDSGGFVWKKKTVPTWGHPKKKSDETQTDYEKRVDAYKWKREKFKKGLGKNLNEVALLMKEDEETFFFLIARILQGYLPKSKDDYPKTLHYQKRKENLEKLKKWFKYDKNVCNETEESDLGRAPWMNVAIQKAKEMGGCEESKEPMYGEAKKFLQYCGNSYEPTDGENGPWCAAFMNWCIGQTKNTSTGKPYLHAKSASSLAPLNSKEKYKKIEEPIYGCIVVYKHNTKWKGHTGFLCGKTKSGKYILLGGNQDDTIRFDEYGEYTSKSKLKKLYGFYIPADYEPTEVDKLNELDIYENEDVVNEKHNIKVDKSKGKTN
ncbi:TIGR02594 family protein [Capnocytophaga catalasegens]|uniref:Peptidase C51 domain-containing protein n=1 Tax=Capnocytophaga catalasegens TaxID=1004260 RepID=A0ABQ4VSQ4_9FLAO|nr:TIGR02594 family protein [Capnocytophaga catalasegens]GJM53355.1 hypothetical protein RCZ16_16720 [Capnocytophaga catalasegens]